MILDGSCEPSRPRKDVHVILSHVLCNANIVDAVHKPLPAIND